MIGSGTPDDPVRPQYAPLPSSLGTPEGIISFAYQVSDDGRFAIAEFVARSRDAFKELLADTRPQVKVFIKGQGRRDDIVAAFRVLKKNFDPDTLSAVAP